MKIRAVIFDLDGTLLDTLTDIADSMNYVLHKMGYPAHPVDNYRYFVGEGMDVLAYKALPEDQRDSHIVEHCHKEMKQRYASQWNLKTAPYNGVVNTLNRLKSLKYKLAVLSNKTHDFTDRMVIHYFGKEIFTEIIGAGRFPKKPSPAAACYEAEQMGVSVQECLYLGDSGIDMQTARSAGMFAVGALWGFRTGAELEENGAQAIIGNISELENLVIN